VAPTVTRQVPAALFVNAPRLHQGLRADEFPAILQRGERVTSKADVQKEQRGDFLEQRGPAMVNNFLLQSTPDIRTQNQIAHKLAVTQRRISARLGA
jgi:hypothetical protein